MNRSPAGVFRNMTLRQHLYYWIGPLIAGWTFIAVYYSNIHWMQEIIAPQYDREFGLLENLDALFIMLSLIVLIRIARLPLKPLFKAGAVFACLVTVVMLLEEIDYGLHFIEWMKGIPPGTTGGIRNLHNQGNNTNRIKDVAYVILAVFFVLLPYVDRLKKFSLVKLLCPSKMICFTVLATVLVAGAHEALDPYNLPTNGVLNSNQSEFEELIIYYTFLIYFREQYGRFTNALDG